MTRSLFPLTRKDAQCACLHPRWNFPPKAEAVAEAAQVVDPPGRLPSIRWIVGLHTLWGALQMTGRVH